jgi:tetraspanin-13/31
MVTSLPIIGGVVASGIFLILISAVGIVGAARHHQVLLFFYMIILFIVFLIQFSVACACLSVSYETQANIATQGWKSAHNSTKNDVQVNFECCGFHTVSNNKSVIEPGMEHPSCLQIEACYDYENSTCTTDHKCCSEPEGYDTCGCPTCEDRLMKVMDKAFQVTGGVSLFFSFTEIIGAVLAWRFRNLYANGLSLS